MAVGREHDRGWRKHGNSDVIASGDAWAGAVHVRHWAVMCGPHVVRPGPPDHVDTCQRLGLPR